MDKEGDNIVCSDQNSPQLQVEEGMKTMVENPAVPNSDDKNDLNTEDCNLHCTEIKEEPQDVENVINHENKLAINTTPQERVDKAGELPQPIQIPMETNEIKEEPDNNEIGIDINMPIAKNSETANDTEFTNPATPFDSSKNTDENQEVLEGTEIHKENCFSEGVNKESTQSGLDEYLDGITTPVAPTRPRLRVKSEFSLIQKPTQQETPYQNKSVEVSAFPLAPPLLPSTYNSDLLADGIATPRISLITVNRLKVKTELLPLTTSPQHYNNEVCPSLPEDLLNDQLQRDVRELGEVTPSNSEADSEDEPIPDDFFDDLLRDELKERIEEAKNNELEEKYSDRLKELEKLNNELKALEEKSKEKRKARKKQKKSKKKSKKRPRSRSPVHINMEEERALDLWSTPFNYTMNKRNRLMYSHMNEPLNLKDNFCKEDLREKDSLLVTGPHMKIKQEIQTNESVNPEGTSFENEEEIEEAVTPKQKRERAIKRATALLNHLENSSSDNNSTFTTFQFVSTVRKLPTSYSYVQQQIYENRSPLHTINNVSYKFNSHTTCFKMEEWGLATLSTHAAKMAKLVGCDAQFIHDKLKIIKIPAKLKKCKQEDVADADEEGEELVETNSSLHCNAMTQTDADNEYNMRHKKKGYDIGVQIEPSVYSIGCQTLEAGLPTKNMRKDDEVPLMNIIRDLNENQLMALHSFAELIKEPSLNANAMNMYKVQMEILEIYKISQIPSSLSASQSQVSNNYPKSSSSSRRRVGPPRPIIQNVNNADGSQFSINDHRAKFTNYPGRIINNCDGPGPSSSSLSNFPSRNHFHTQPHHGRPAMNEGAFHYDDLHQSQAPPPTSRYRQPHMSNQLSPTMAKRYGRGNLRR